MMIDQVQTTRLANGLTILTEHMPGLRSVSLGIWVRRGSRHETPALNGICHFIEHALFKAHRVWIRKGWIDANVIRHDVCGLAQGDFLA